MMMKFTLVMVVLACDARSTPYVFCDIDDTLITHKGTSDVLWEDSVYPGMVEFVKALAREPRKNVKICSARPKLLKAFLGINSDHPIRKIFGDFWGVPLYGDVLKSLLGFCWSWSSAGEVKYRESFAFIRDQKAAGAEISHVFFVGDDGQGDIRMAYKWFKTAKKLKIEFTAYIRQVRRRRNFDSKEQHYQHPNEEFRKELQEMIHAGKCVYFDNAAEGSVTALKRGDISTEGAAQVRDGIQAMMARVTPGTDEFERYCLADLAGDLSALDKLVTAPAPTMPETETTEPSPCCHGWRIVFTILVIIGLVVGCYLCYCCLRKGTDFKDKDVWEDELL